jgi:hypothetical protein
MESGTETDQATAGDRDTSTGRWLPGHSGNPVGSRDANQKANLRAVELFDQWVADFDRSLLTAIERSLLEQAARLMVRAERTHDPDIAVRASSVAQRMLASVRTKKRKRAGRPPLREQLAEVEPVG